MAVMFQYWLPVLQSLPHPLLMFPPCSKPNGRALGFCPLLMIENPMTVETRFLKTNENVRKIY